eukprot:TRINITY_DN22658_c0_g1_i1.p1 TRINITY_DN22658_c0_g1~~TRINITY_DN22658_c0_g1_i1.p1  ORF type:complete len:151 (+),score=19.09 TRINITY_DN22658_c0_g1_i1:203-655(+)
MHQVSGRDSCRLVPEVKGKIALVQRSSTCSHAAQARLAQQAGALAYLFCDTLPGGPRTLGATAPNITLPILALSYQDCLDLTRRTKRDDLSATVYRFSNHRDTAFNNDVIFHEYTHGISQRLVGPNCLDNVEQMGVGWSDIVAVNLTYSE